MLSITISNLPNPPSVLITETRIKKNYNLNLKNMKSKFTSKILLLSLLGIIISITGCKKDDEIPFNEIPTISAVTPAEGTVSTELTIKGTNFMEGLTVYVGDVPCSNVEVSSATIIYAKVPSGIPANTFLPVKVANTGGGNTEYKDAFKAIDPVLSFVNSATQPSGNAGSTVILEGRAFGDLQGEGDVLFSDGSGGTIPAVIAAADDWTDEFIVTTVPGGAADGPVVVKTEIGTSNEMEFKVTTAATFSPSTINWTETTALPLAVSGHKALSLSIENVDIITRYVFVSGGRDGDGAASDQVIKGMINADGTISSWEPVSSLPGPLSFHASVTATPFNSRVDGSGYLFTIGGKNADGTTISGVSAAALNSDGTLQSWSAARALPEPLHSAGAVIFRSTIYVAGGATTGNNPVPRVYKASIKENGQLGEWESLPELPEGIAYHGFVSFGGYLYTVGGDTGNVTPYQGSQGTGIKEIFYARINLRTGDIGEWTENPNSIGKERSKHSTLVLGGNMFISSGLYSGLSGNVGGSSENAYASINADGTISSFNGATGSNTLFSRGGSNLFNQSGISYIDSDGVAHVMILGGAKVGSPDTKLDKVLFY